jgi:hypothetical protein
MADLIQNYDFDNAIQGNTYQGVIFNLPREEVFSLDGARIYMQLRKKPGQTLAAEFSTENQKISILDKYSFSFTDQIIDVAADTYEYDILILFSDGRRETYIGGRWTIQPCVTHKKI